MTTWKLTNEFNNKNMLTILYTLRLKHCVINGDKQKSYLFVSIDLGVNRFPIFKVDEMTRVYDAC